MVTIYQTRDFLSGRSLNRSKNLGSFFSIESAEEKLGWFFVKSCCDAVKF